MQIIEKPDFVFRQTPLPKDIEICIFSKKPRDLYPLKHFHESAYLNTEKQQTYNKHKIL